MSADKPNQWPGAFQCNQSLWPACRPAEMELYQLISQRQPATTSQWLHTFQVTSGYQLVSDPPVWQRQSRTDTSETAAHLIQSSVGRKMNLIWCEIIQRCLIQPACLPACLRACLTACLTAYYEGHPRHIAEIWFVAYCGFIYEADAAGVTFTSAHGVITTIKTLIIFHQCCHMQLLSSLPAGPRTETAPRNHTPSLVPDKEPS